MRWLDPAHECRCILLHGPPGIGKTALAIKVANDLRETDKNTMVVYVNCKCIYSADDFAEKVLVQIYHYPSNNPISGLKTRLINSDFNKYTIILLDNFEFLIHVDDWIENQQIEEPVDRINFCALGEFDQAKPYSEIALEIRRKLLNEHMDTAKSLFDLGMVHKERGDFQQAIRCWRTIIRIFKGKIT